MRELNSNLTGFMATNYTWFLIVMGRFDELNAEAQRLLQTDPYSNATKMTVIQAYYYARQYKRSIEACNNIIQLDPTYAQGYRYLADNFDQLELHEDAHKSRLLFLEHFGYSSESISAYDSLYKKLGYKAYESWLLLRVQNQKSWFDKNPIPAARIYTKLNEKKKALDYLDIAYEKREGALSRINVEPKWDPLRDEPRFQQLVKQMNFPD